MSLLCASVRGLALPLGDFFRISFSRVSRPSTRSSSAILDCSAVSGTSVWKTICARSKKALFQLAKRFGLSECLRQASAWDWTPVRTSSTRRTLNSEVNRQRVCMEVRLQDALNYHYAPVQFL